MRPYHREPGAHRGLFSSVRGSRSDLADRGKPRGRLHGQTPGLRQEPINEEIEDQEESDRAWNDATRVRRNDGAGGRRRHDRRAGVSARQNLNNKLNIAFIACGGRANASLSELTIVPGREPARRTAAASAAGADGAASGRERHRPLRREPGRAGLRVRSVTRRPRNSPTCGGSSTARTTSTPSWSPRPSTRTPLPPTWR